MSPNCLNIQKALRVRFGDQEDRTPLFKSKKTSPDRFDLFTAESHESVTRKCSIAGVLTAEA